MKEHYLMGLDIGGTKIECALIQLQDHTNTSNDFFITTKRYGHLGARFMRKERIPTMRDKGYTQVLTNISELCLKVLKEEKLTPNELDGIGIGLPGTVDPKTKIMLNGNSGIFIGKDITKDLQKLLNTNIKITCANDANLFALAEVLCGAGQKYAQETKIPIHQQVGVGLILGTGVGGGIIFKEQMLEGKNGGGGEVGHSVLHTGGYPCYCGNNGCAEQYLSGTAIEALYSSRIYSQIQEHPNTKRIFEMALQHEPLAIAVIKEYQKDLLKFLANMTNLFDPDYFVLGGGVSTQSAVYLGLEERLAQTSFVPPSAPRIYKHVIGDSSGVVGASLLILLDEENQ